MKRISRKAVLAGLACVGMIVLFASAGSGSRSDERGAVGPREVELASVQYQALSRTIDVVGTLFGDEEATIGAKVSGRLRRNLVDVADRVEPGQPLAEIDPADYELAVNERKMALAEAAARIGLSGPADAKFDVASVATVQKAKFQAANAKVKLDRARQLLNQQPPLISAQDFADLETAYQVAEREHQVALLEARSQLALVHTRASELAAAEQRLADTTVRAPELPARGGETLTYTVARRERSPGEFVREADPLFHLVLDDPMEMRAAVPERYLGSVKNDQELEIRVESYQQPFIGRITRISPAVSPESRTFSIEAQVPNPSRLLRSGSFARGLIRIGEEQAPHVPKTAVASFAGVQRIFSVRDGKAVEHVVKLGAERGDLVAVLEGLPPEVRQVISGSAANKLSDGQPVLVR